MKNLLLLLCNMFLLQACSESESDRSPGNASQIAFSLKDAQGNDLLNPNHSNYYSKDSIKIYNTAGVLMNAPITVFNDERTAINAFVYGVTHMCNEEEMQDLYCKRYWYWNASEVDTVEVFLKEFDNERIDSYKFKINGVEYNLDIMETRVIQLVK